MARKPSPTHKNAKPPRIEDLKLIHGIGPEIEKKLNGVGIYTFAQLTAMLPADISAAVAGLAGASTDRIIKQDWIGQARKLATSSISTEAQLGSEIPMEPQHLSTFTLELLLDKDNDVRRSHITHIESGEEDAWDSWQDRRLVNFLVHRAGLNVPLLEPIASDVAAKEPLPPAAAEPALAVPVVVAATAPLGGVLRISEVEVVSAESPGPQKLLHYGQPFEVHVTLDLSDVIVFEDTPLSYKISVYGKSVEGHPCQTVGEISGISKPIDSVTLNVRGTTPPTGIYRLQTLATLRVATIEPMTSTELKAMTESNLLLIF